MKAILTILTIVLLTAANASAQRNTAPMKGIQVTYKPVTGNPSQFTTQLQITLLDTSGISKVNVKMGTQRNSTDLLSKDFTYDVSGNLGDGTSYSRTGSKIILGLGSNFGKMDHFYGEVVIERSDNSSSDPITFSR